jgi:hypothetical protein
MPQSCESAGTASVDTAQKDEVRFCGVCAERGNISECNAGCSFEEMRASLPSVGCAVS